MWPKVTILALVILFAVYAFIAAGLQAMRAFTSFWQITMGIELRRVGKTVDSVTENVA